MKKIITVVGARPQFVKTAAISKIIEKAGNIFEIMVHTGQHYDSNMSQTFFDDLEIPLPKYNLGVGGGSHGFQTGEIIKRLESVLKRERPSLLMVYGDTNTTLAGALTAVKLHIPVAHVEAGLRSYNKNMPEEINRIVADHVSNILFCPTTTAVKNLEGEGITKNVFNVGDVMFDVVLKFSAKADGKSRILREHGLKKNEFILATIHRAENTDSKHRLSNIFLALKKLTEEVAVIVPLHPRTKKMLRNFDLWKHLEGIMITEPLGFLDMLCLEKNAKLIATDSGGVQKEAYFHKVPCVTLRDETEWVETIDSQWNILANVNSIGSITEAVHKSLSFSNLRCDISEYGDGRASEKVVNIVKRFLNSSEN